MELSLIGSIVSAVIAIASGYFAWRRARAAEKSANAAQVQADSVKHQANLLRATRISILIEKCIDFHRQNGEWQTYLKSEPNLTAQDYLNIDDAVRVRLKKNIEKQKQKEHLFSFIKEVSKPGRSFGLIEDRESADLMKELFKDGDLVEWHGEYFLKGHEPKE